MMKRHDRLIAAVQVGDAELVMKLAKDNCDLEPTDLLHYAARLGNIEVLNALVNSGWHVQLNAFDDMSFTPLMWVAKNDNADAVRFLLGAGSAVNARDERNCGNTVICEVAESCSFEIARILIDAGADPEIPGWMQLTAIDRVKERIEKTSDQSSQAILEMMLASKRPNR